MASSRATGQVAEASTGGFSYAQAAKGRSPSAPSAKGSNNTMSGATTPASASMSDSTPGSSWADDGETNGVTTASNTKDEIESSENGVTDSSKEAQNTEMSHEQVSDVRENVSEPQEAEDAKPLHNGIVDGESLEKTDSASTPKATESTEEKVNEPKEKPAVKPVYHESKPPAVNPWLQRAADAKSKTGSPTQAHSSSTGISGTENERSRVESKRKPEQALARKNEPRVRDEVRNGRPGRESRPEENGAQRKAVPKPRERTTSEAVPSVNNETSWPKPTDSPDEDRKTPEERPEKERAALNGAKGKPEWKAMPYTPTAVFETQITGRGSGRMGKGAARGGPTGPGRVAIAPINGALDGQRPAGRTSSLPNGDSAVAEKPDMSRNDRESMPPPPAKAGRVAGESPKDLKNTEQAKTLAPITTDMAKSAEFKPPTAVDASTRQPPAARTNKSPRKSEGFVKRNGSVNEPNGRRQSVTAQADDSPAGAYVNGTDAATPKSAFPERSAAFENGRDAPFRGEGKRGRGKGGRGAFANGHFASPHGYGNGYDFQNGAYGMGQPFTPRGGHFPQSGRGGYRHQQTRSQSIDQFGRSMPYGYPMMPMQPFGQDYYGSYPANPYGLMPQNEREFLVVQTTGQLDYYFSMDNLLKDLYLRKHMDAQGWILLTVVAEFNRLKTITTDYDVIKQACLQSQEIEIRVADDGKDRVRRVADWERWVLPAEERDTSAQSEPPNNLRRPSAPRIHSFDQIPPFYPASPQNAYPRMDRSFQMTNGGPPPFYPSGFQPQSNEFIPHEESRGRQTKPTHRDHDAASLTNGHTVSSDTNGEPDTFPSAQIEGLTVVVRKHDQKEAPFHNANSRTFSNGSIDSRNIMEEVSKSQEEESSPHVNGDGPSTGARGSAQSSDTLYSSDQSLDDEANALTLFWVKDKESPVDVNTLPPDTTHEPYLSLRHKALSQHEAAATGTCPYDLDVLYQFWSHFLIRNFNSHMYAEFHDLATEDITKRHNDTGLKNLIKYYNEALSSQIPIRDGIARAYADLVQKENIRSERPAFNQLRAAWKSGSLNLGNRKKLSDILDDNLKAELDA